MPDFEDRKNETEVIGVRFKTVGKIYYFSPNGEKFDADDYVVVETARGVEFGKVCLANRFIVLEKEMLPLKPIIRFANADDIEQNRQNKLAEKEALAVCSAKVKEHNLEMKLIDAEFTFDKSKVLFYFTADGRIDFRDLVKDLAAVFKTRIELRQIGVRDEAKALNGIGICGKSLCCATFLNDFQPVSIKMAKYQSLSLNPTKISGVCGRLMCCLKYEEEAYYELKKNLPNIGDIVKTQRGEGQVLSINTLRQIVKIAFTTDNSVEFEYFHVSEIEIRKAKKQKKAKETIDKELLDLLDE